MLIAGSSAGSEDFTPALMEKPGELLVHGITVMPGKPTLLVAADCRPRHPHAAAQAFSHDEIAEGCNYGDGLFNVSGKSIGRDIKPSTS